MTVQRFAAVTRLRPEKEADYRRLHDAVWPGVLAALKAAHVQNYSIYLRDGLLFSYLEYNGVDYAADMAAMAADATTQEWWKITDPCQRPIGSADDGRPWIRAEELFHLD